MEVVVDSSRLGGIEHIIVRGDDTEDTDMIRKIVTCATSHLIPFPMLLLLLLPLLLPLLLKGGG